MSDDNVSLFPGATPLPFDPNVMLDAAKKKGLKEVVIVGFDSEGEHFFSSSIGDSANVLYHLFKAMYRLMRMEEKMGEGE